MSAHYYDPRSASQKREAPVASCPRCGFTTDNTMAMREHILKQMRGFDPCKPKDGESR